MTKKDLIGYGFQAGGAITAAVGLYFAFSHKEIFGTLVAGAFAWFVGGFIRKKF